MTENSNERLIYLKDLLFVVLRGWRVLIITALVFALVLGGAKAVLEIQSIETKNAAAEAEYNRARAEYEEALKTAEEAYADAKAKVEEYRNYIEKSVYMQLDSEKFYEMEFVFFIDVDEELEKYQRIISSEYCYLLNDYDVVVHLAECLEIKPSHMREIYSVKKNTDGDTIQITGSCNDEASAKRLLSKVEKLVADASKKVAQTVEEHSIIILQANVSQQSDPTIKETQDVIKGKLQEYEVQLQEAEDARNALVAPAAQYASAFDAIKSAVIFAIIGALIGCVIIIAYLWIRHIFGYKVYSASILNAVTNAKILGCMAKDLVKNPIDRMLMKLEGRDVTEPEVRAKLLAADIRNRCGDISKLLVTGDAEASSRKILVDALQNAMQGIQVEDNGSLFGSVSAVESLAKCDAVVFVEQCECSLYENVEKEAEMVTDYGKKLIGCVLLDG